MQLRKVGSIQEDGRSHSPHLTFSSQKWFKYHQFCKYIQDTWHQEKYGNLAMIDTKNPY